MCRPSQGERCASTKTGSMCLGQNMPNTQEKSHPIVLEFKIPYEGDAVPNTQKKSQPMIWIEIEIERPSESGAVFQIRFHRT